MLQFANEITRHLIGNITSLQFASYTLYSMGSDCGSVGRAAASNNRCPRFESSHWRTFIQKIYLLSTVLKRRKQIKRDPGMAHFNSLSTPHSSSLSGGWHATESSSRNHCLQLCLLPHEAVTQTSKEIDPSLTQPPGLVNSTSSIYNHYKTHFGTVYCVPAMQCIGGLPKVLICPRIQSQHLKSLAFVCQFTK